MTSRPATIFALSSGRPPAGIAVVRISGPDAGTALANLAGRIPEPRHASLAALRDRVSGELLDRAMILWMPGPNSATGDDIAELHLHGGRAVVDGVLRALAAQRGLRAAEPGEFTRRAFENGRIDLNEAEGLADLLAAETDSQRRLALQSSGGALSRKIEEWRGLLLNIAAGIEGAIDYSDEDDLPVDTEQLMIESDALRTDMQAMLARPLAERLRDGLRVVVAGPPNSGKSSLINALAGRDAAIESPVPGTTRDIIEVPVVIAGIPIILTDTAGLRESEDEVEAIGITKAQRAAESADIVLWLGDDDIPVRDGVIALHARCDVRPVCTDRLSVSARTGHGLSELVNAVASASRHLLPREGELTLNRRQHDGVLEIAELLGMLRLEPDLLIAAEHARASLAVVDRLTGRAGVEDMLDSLFSQFCIGK